MKNFKKMPKQEEVTEFQLGDMDAKVVKVTDENREYLVDVALSMYANEPCRICGELIGDVRKSKAVYAGYSKDNKSRSAHGSCWNKNIPQENWAYPD